MVFDGRPIIGVSCCAASNCAFFAVSFSARRDLVQHRGREGGEDAPERARVDRDGGLEHQTCVAGRQNSSIECTSPLENTKAAMGSK